MSRAARTSWNEERANPNSHFSRRDRMRPRRVRRLQRALFAPGARPRVRPPGGNGSTCTSPREPDAGSFRASGCGAGGGVQADTPSSRKSELTREGRASERLPVPSVAEKPGERVCSPSSVLCYQRRSVRNVMAFVPGVPFAPPCRVASRPRTAPGVMFQRVPARQVRPEPSESKRPV